MMFGLTQKDIDLIREALKIYPEIEAVMIYGSRAVGNFNKGSDIDLAIKGANVTADIISGLRTRLEEDLPIPYFFDVVAYDTIKSEKLLEEINRNGQLFYP